MYNLGDRDLVLGTMGIYELNEESTNEESTNEESTNEEGGSIHTVLT